MCTYGYVRVSSRDQNEERQIDAMKRAGLAEDHLFVDKKSGKDFDRPQYKKMMKKLRKGDVLYILSVITEKSFLSGTFSPKRKRYI